MSTKCLLVLIPLTLASAGFPQAKNTTPFVRFAATGAAAADTKVSEWMTEPVDVAAPDLPVIEAFARFRTKHYRHLPVVDRGNLVGIISIGDLVKHRLREMEMETGVLRDRVIARH